MNTHPDFRKSSQLLEESRSLQESFEDLLDLLDIRSAKAEEGDAPTVSLAEIKR